MLHTGARSNRKGLARAMRCVAIFIVLIGVFYGVVHSPGSEGRLFEPLLRAVARVSGSLLGALGHEAVVDGRWVRTPEFTFQIVRGCDGLEPLAVYVSAVIASPVAIGPKALGAALGILALTIINFLRIVSLYYVALYFPKSFELVHEDYWQPAFVLLAVCAWAAWGIWATRRTQITRNANH